MAKLWELLRGGFSPHDPTVDPDDLSFGFNGNRYPLVGSLSRFGRDVEEIENNFGAYIQGAYKANGVIFATSLARSLLFTEARFAWRRLVDGRPSDLFYDSGLELLRRPWPNGTTGELLARAEQDVTAAGNFYVAVEGERLRRLRPDWVSIVLTAPPEEAVESDVKGYLYRPGGLGAKTDGKLYLPEEVAHWSPIPDPEAQYRGMSWMAPVLREVLADKAATTHKLRFFQNGATLGPVVSLKETVTKEQFADFIRAMNEAHQGADNAYKTMYVGGGASVTLSTADLRQLDFKGTQGAGETRITAAGGVPAVIVGLSEGLQAATYSNYSQARRKFGDHWARPQWRSFCAAMEPLLSAPDNAELWYDDRDIAFLREDQKDAASIQQIKAQTVRQYLDAGFSPESVIAAVEADDLGLLAHSGLYSVQLQPPGATDPAADGDQGADDQPPTDDRGADQ